MEMDMRDSDWKILYELYQDPNLTHVAGRLYVSQPAVTKRLKQMEEEFAVAIVDRTPKGLEFTPAGEYLAERAEAYLNFQNETLSRLKEFQNEEDREIRIGSSYTFSKHSLPDLLFRYQAQHPDVRFRITTDQSDLLFRKVVDHEIDIGFIWGNYEGAVCQTLLGSEGAYLVSSEPVELTQLFQMRYVSYKTNDRSVELIKTWWYGKFRSEMPKGMPVGFVDVALQLIHRGLGYTICFLPDDFENTYGLCLTPLVGADGKPVRRNTWMVYPKGRCVTALAKNFIRFVSDF
ncbi:MAG: LysR family transcriptional regulator [Clostridiales bacterium]|nr:LysR family transcriptional regulator [Clostridiales bacterium]